MAQKLDLEKYRKQLLEQRQHLQASIGRPYVQTDVLGSSATSAGELSDYPDHPADQGTETFDRERDMTLRENARDLLVLVEDALRKLENGTYGECSSCKKPIPAGRLDAMPSAVYCVPCQNMLESLGTI